MKMIDDVLKICFHCDIPCERKNVTDWNAVVDYALRENIAARLYRHLQCCSICANDCGEEIRIKLQNNYYTIAALNLTTWEKVKNFIVECNSAGIGLMPFKAAYLNFNIYDDIAARSCGDWDILIKRDDLKKADIILSRAGFLNSTGLPENNRLSNANALIYRNTDGTMNSYIHLHWHLLNSSWPIERYVKYWPIEEAWCSAKSYHHDGLLLQKISCEDLLLHLSYHGFMHFFERMNMVIDLAAVTDRYSEAIDWDRLIDKAVRYKLLPVLVYCQKYIEEYSIGNTFALEKLKFPLPKMMHKMIAARSRCYEDYYFAFYNMQQGIDEKVNFLWKSLIPSRWAMAVNTGKPITRVNIWDYLQRFK